MEKPIGLNEYHVAMLMNELEIEGNWDFLLVLQLAKCQSDWGLPTHRGVA